jgi:hypothetical protein
VMANRNIVLSEQLRDNIYKEVCSSYFGSYTPNERGLKSKNFIFRNFFKNHPIKGNFKMY